MKKKVPFLLATGLLVAVAVAFLATLQRPSGQAQAADPPKDSKRKTDEEAVRKVTADFFQALEKGDAKAVAGFWTEEGEYVAENGTTLRGRKAIEEEYAEEFAKNKLKVEGTVENVRFVSRDLAVEEGYVRVQTGKPDQTPSSRYSLLFTRENGNWLIAVLREWPDEGTALRDLDWLIGTWTSKTPKGEVSTTYAWDESKNFIHVSFSIKEKDQTISGTQIIGKDPRTGQLHSWIFESDGGFGEASWAEDGKRWVLTATGVEPDGSEMTATNILQPLDKNSFTWQSTDRKSGDDELPDIAPVKVTRVK
jgi:uncharacterized protein (TIGR02246 family)